MNNSNEKIVQRLAGALQIPTVSNAVYSETDFKPFDEFVDYLQRAFPLFHKTLPLERINTYGLVYYWAGSDQSLDPIVLMAHYDVVPPGIPENWKYPAFSGKIADGYVWGRGTLDIKSQLIGYLEAAERLMEAGFQPQRSIYFAFGHDEEVGGEQGAGEIVKVFEERGLKFHGVLDEGGLIISGAVKGIKKPVGLIGVAEKGYADYKIIVDGSGGHSSMPGRKTALGQLAKIIYEIQEHPLPARITPPVQAFLDNVVPEMSPLVRFVASKPRYFGSVLKKILAGSPETDAMIRTTFAPTTITGSAADNVLPESTTVNINVRLLQGDTSQAVAAHFRKLAGKIPVRVDVPDPREASEVSPTDGDFYQKLTAISRKFFPKVIFTPYLMMGGTDSRKFHNLTKFIYRFSPVHVTKEEKDTIHNANERIKLTEFAQSVDWFEKFIGSF
jgi:carboxypeptidase PM20D1